MPWGARAYKRVDPLHYLPEKALPALANLLCCPATSDDDTHISREWLDAQRACIERFPPTHKLHRSQSLATFFSIDETTGARLCDDHYALKPELIFWCYKFLNEEVSQHTEAYRNLRKKHPNECTDELREYIDRVTAIATLYKSREVFDEEFGSDALPDEERYERVSTRCAACVLSVVGARAQMLVDLRAGMLARKWKGKWPRLLPLIDAWIDAFHDERLEMRLESEQTGEELRLFRHRARKHRRREGGQERREGGEVKHWRKKERTGSWSQGMSDFFGKRIDAAKQTWKEKRAESRQGRESSPRPSSPSGRPRSRHQDPSPQGEFSEERRSTSRPPSMRTVRPGSSISNRYHDDGRNSVYSLYDPDAIANAGDSSPVRGRPYAVSPETSPRLGSAHDSDVSSVHTTYSDQRGRQQQQNPYRMSFASTRRGSTASVSTIRPDDPAPVVPAPPASSSSNLRYIYDERPGDPRHSWSSRVMSLGSEASTRPPSRPGSSSGLSVHNNDAELRRVLEDLGLNASDVPMDAQGYKDLDCPSSDSEDEEEVEQYIPARAGWGKGKDKETAAAKTNTHSSCPVCGVDLSDSTPVQANDHVNDCLDEGGAAPKPARNVMDDVTDSYGGLNIHDKESAPRTWAEARRAGRFPDERGRSRDSSVSSSQRRDSSVSSRPGSVSSRRDSVSSRSGSIPARRSSFSSSRDRDVASKRISTSSSVYSTDSYGERPASRISMRSVDSSTRAERRQSKLGGGKFKGMVRDG